MWDEAGESKELSGGHIFKVSSLLVWKGMLLSASVGEILFWNPNGYAIHKIILNGASPCYLTDCGEWFAFVASDGANGGTIRVFNSSFQENGSFFILGFLFGMVNWRGFLSFGNYEIGKEKKVRLWKFVSRQQKPTNSSLSTSSPNAPVHSPNGIPKYASGFLPQPNNAPNLPSQQRVDQQRPPITNPSHPTITTSQHRNVNLSGYSQPKVDPSQHKTSSFETYSVMPGEVDNATTPVYLKTPKNVSSGSLPQQKSPQSIDSTLYSGILEGVDSMNLSPNYAKSPNNIGGTSGDNASWRTANPLSQQKSSKNDDSTIYSGILEETNLPSNPGVPQGNGKYTIVKPAENNQVPNLQPIPTNSVDPYTGIPQTTISNNYSGIPNQSFETGYSFLCFLSSEISLIQ